MYGMLGKTINVQMFISPLFPSQDTEAWAVSVWITEFTEQPGQQELVMGETSTYHKVGLAHGMEAIKAHIAGVMKEMSKP